MNEDALSNRNPGKMFKMCADTSFVTRVSSTKCKDFTTFLLYLLCRPGTTIAITLGGVFLFLILLALLVFYLRRQKQQKRKETMRRILQEHEVRCFAVSYVCSMVFNLYSNLFKTFVSQKGTFFYWFIQYILVFIIKYHNAFWDCYKEYMQCCPRIFTEEAY